MGTTGHEETEFRQEEGPPGGVRINLFLSPHDVLEAVQLNMHVPELVPRRVLEAPDDLSKGPLGRAREGNYSRGARCARQSQRTALW